MLITPAGILVVVTCTGALLLMVMLKPFADVCCVGVSESMTCTVKDDVPVAVGVPVIAPVELLIENPAGKLAELMLHV